MKQLGLSALPKTIKEIRTSISFKLILLFILTAVCLTWLLWYVLGVTFQNHFTDNVRPHVSQYLRYLRDEIGYPPNITAAKIIAEKSQANIIIEGPNVIWSSSGEYLDPRFLDLKIQRMNQFGDADRVGFYKGNFVLQSVRKDYITTFITKEKLANGPSKSELLYTIASSLVLVVILYFFIHRLFSPVRRMEQGVRQIGDGDFSRRIQLKRNDELGLLANSINKMADNIEFMLEAKKQLLLAISHELRTPLTRAKIAISMLDDSATKDSLNEDIAEMEELIKELLEAERLKETHQALDLELVDIKALIEDVCLRFYSKENVVQSIADNLPALQLDHKRVSLAIKNIIKNALSARKQPGDSVWIRVYQVDNKVVIEVEDKGIGMSANELAQITEPFYRADNSRQRRTGGFGVGLYIVKLIFQAHGAELTFDSQETIGTVVRIKFQATGE